MDLLPLLKASRLEDLTRIDVGLEGDWSGTVQVVWTRKDGSQSLDAFQLQHPTFKPSLELYYKDGWIGLHCFLKIEDGNVLDEGMVNHIIDLVERALAAGAKGG